jgi:hypothetical protein
MTAQPEQLEESSIWDAQGHLAEVAVTALADGELWLLPAAALAHADSCALCADRIGSSSLVALSLSEALSVAATRTELQMSPEHAASTRPPLPLGLLAGALLVAALGSLPNLTRFWALLFRLPELVARALPVLARVAVLVGHGLTDNQALSVLRWVSAVSLLCAGIAIASLSPHNVRRPLEKGAS